MYIICIMSSLIRLTPLSHHRRAAVLPSMSEPKQSQPPKKTTEELELEEVKRLQKEAKKALQQSRRSFQRLGKSSGPVVVKGSKPTTQAKEFNFHTKDRERSRPGSATKKEGVNTTNFPQTLRNFNSTDNYNPNFVSCVCMCVRRFACLVDFLYITEQYCI